MVLATNYDEPFIPLISHYNEIKLKKGVAVMRVSWKIICLARLITYKEAMRANLT